MISIDVTYNYLILSRDSFDISQSILLTSVYSCDAPGYQHFFLFPQCFQKASFTGSLKVGIVKRGLEGQ